MDLRDLPTWEERKSTKRPFRCPRTIILLQSLPLPFALPFTMTLEVSYYYCLFAVDFVAASLVTQRVRVADWHAPRGDYLQTCCFWAYKAWRVNVIESSFP